MKRLLCMIFSVILLATFVPTSVQAASKKEVKAVEKQVNSFLKAAKNYDVNKMKKHLAPDAEYTRTYSNMVNSWLKKRNQKCYDYYIYKVNVKGKTAKVKVDISAYNSYGAVIYFYSRYFWDYASVDDAKVTPKYFKKVMNYYYKNYQKGDRTFANNEDYTELTNFGTVTIPLVKVNGKWKIEKISNKFYRYIDGGVQDALNDIEKDPIKYIHYTGD